MAENTKMHWVRFFPSDWLGGTRGMTAAETGIYITLLMTMYERGQPLVEDNARLARLCGASNSVFKSTLESLIEQGKLIRKSEGIWNEKVGRELSYTSEKSSVAQKKANIRWKEKDNKNNDTHDATAILQQSNSNANQKPDIRYNKSNTNVLPKKTKKDFEIEFSQAFWPAYPNKVGKPFALKSFLKARQSASLEEIMAGLERYKTTKPADRAWCNPSTFLNQERWLDEPANVEQRNAGNYNNQQPMGNQVADKIRQLGANRDAKRGTQSSSTDCSNAFYGGQRIDRERENANQIDNQRGQTIDLIACK